MQVAAGEVREVCLDLLGGRQFRGQQLVANVLDGGRFEDEAGACSDRKVGLRTDVRQV